MSQISEEHEQPNAMLIAAAPDLLAALRQAEGLPELCGEIGELEQYGGPDDKKSLLALRREFKAVRKAIRAAIARATGAS